jgi:DNA-binding transcriptional MerR regulator
MADSAAGKMYTLTEVSKITNISMPTLQRYKKAYQDRIPSTGEGRKQRYPEGALKVFKELKTENVGRRGRPRKTAAAGAAPAKRAPARKARAKKAAPAKAAAGGGEKLLTLMEVGKLTNISYPTLLRYVTNHLKEIPHTGSGRNRRYYPEAVAVFKKLRAESKTGRKAGSKNKPKAAAAAAPAKKRGPGRPRKSAAKAAAPAKRGPGRPRKVASDTELAVRVKELEKANKKLEKDVARLEKLITKPFKVTLARK